MAFLDQIDVLGLFLYGGFDIEVDYGSPPVGVFESSLSPLVDGKSKVESV